MTGVFVKLLKDDIDDLIKTAFQKVNIIGEKCWVDIREIDLDYTVCEEQDLYPIVTVTVAFCTILDDEQELHLRIDLEESREYIIGHLASAFERCESDE